MRVLILGGTGFIGSYVTRLLARQGAAVHVFHRGLTRADVPASVRAIHGDRDQLERRAAALRALNPDVVVDMIAFTEADARATIEVFRGAAGRLVTISSMDVYRAFDIIHGGDDGQLQPVPIPEDSDLRKTLFPLRGLPEERRPENRPAAYEKILVERVCREQSALPATVLRLPLVYGPGDTTRRRAFPYVKRMTDARPAILLGRRFSRWIVSRGYVENVAAAIAAAVMSNRAAGRTYNVADADALTARAWVEQIRDAAGWRGRIVEVPDESLPAAIRVDGNFAQHWLLDTSRIRRELGYREVVGLAEGLHRTVEWERANPPAMLPADACPYEEEDVLLMRLGGDAGTVGQAGA